MKIDNYTKFLLTVITICLVYLCARDMVTLTKVQAQSDLPTRVMLVDEENHPVAAMHSVGAGGGYPLKVKIEDH